MIRIVEDANAERIAGIIGEQGAMAKALIELKRRKAEGEDVVILWARRHNTMLVGPRPSSQEEA